MTLPIVLMLVCSVFIAFFVAFLVIFVLAKITSMPSRKKSEIEEYQFAGAKYRVEIGDITKTNKLSQVKVRELDKNKRY